MARPVALVLLLHVVSAAASCPLRCRCEGGRVDCAPRGGSLVSIPDNLGPKTRIMDFSYNNISSITNLHLYPDLEVIDLSHNLIVDVTGFDKNPHLKVISLAGNMIKKLSFSLNVTSELDDLDLSNNEVEVIDSESSNSWMSTRNINLANNNITGKFIINSAVVNMNLSHNQIKSISGNFSKLETIDLSHNSIQDIDQVDLLNTRVLSISLSSNPIAWIPDGAFVNCSHLQVLELNHLLITSIPELAFIGLTSIQDLRLHGMSDLQHIHPNAFRNLKTLQELDLQNNGLRKIDFQVLKDLNTTDIKLNGNPLRCDCVNIVSLQFLANLSSNTNLTCAMPQHLHGSHISAINSIDCSNISVNNYSKEIYAAIGTALVIDCPADGLSPLAITWTTNRGVQYEFHPSSVNYKDLDPEHLRFHDNHGWHQSREYQHMSIPHEQRIHVLKNGSLYIDYITRRDGGHYRCDAYNQHGNRSSVIRLWLDYSLLTSIKQQSILVGFSCAIIFFTLTVLTSAVKFAAFFFSEKERKKRSSIKELLETLNSYKSSKVEQFSAYKSAKMDQFSAFKTAKMDQWNAFTEAKVEKLTEFKSKRINKMRTYKQLTVTNILHQTHCMREYYAHQINRVKENCAFQADKLKENTSNQMNRVKDLYGSLHIDKIRENYQVQAVRIRDYGATQMARLREQYKLQQTHIIKLLELLDVGNCMTVIEAECQRTESMIFDQNIDLDLDAQHMDVDSYSDYMTPEGLSAASSIASFHTEPTVAQVEVSIRTPKIEIGENDADNEHIGHEDENVVKQSKETTV